MILLISKAVNDLSFFAIIDASLVILGVTKLVPWLFGSSFTYIETSVPKLE
jgi:hypothetical protein